jgi:hypothetical protein
MDLKVPYAEKDEVKALGARWEPARRCWYIPDGLDLRPFRRWIPAPDVGLPGLNLRSLETYVVTAPRRCWRCEQATTVVGFLMAPDFEDFSVWEGDLDGGGRWGGGEGWCFAFYIDTLPSTLAAQAMTRAPRYRRAFSKTTQSSYWANHCSECGALQGDFHLFEEPGEPFLPRDSRDLAGHRAFAVKGVFQASGSFGHDIDVATQIPGVRNAPTTNPAPKASGGIASDSTSPSVWRKVGRWLGWGPGG